jgi:hypothetical protein
MFTRSNNVLVNKANQKRQKSRDQQQWKNTFANLAKLWNELSPEEQLAFNQGTNYFGEPSKVSIQMYLTGFNQFMRGNLFLASISEPYVNAFPFTDYYDHRYQVLEKEYRVDEFGVPNSHIEFEYLPDDLENAVCEIWFGGFLDIPTEQTPKRWKYITTLDDGVFFLENFNSLDPTMPVGATNQLFFLRFIVRAYPWQFCLNWQDIFIPVTFG